MHRRAGVTSISAASGASGIVGVVAVHSLRFTDSDAATWGPRRPLDSRHGGGPAADEDAICERPLCIALGRKPLRRDRLSQPRDPSRYPRLAACSKDALQILQPEDQACGGNHETHRDSNSDGDAWQKQDAVVHFELTVPLRADVDEERHDVQDPDEDVQDRQAESQRIAGSTEQQKPPLTVRRTTWSRPGRAAHGLCLCRGCR
mmetsp:Transcript_1569/g.3529  ORF Transcript_1569/g.3529 Transcript_1569/m.3529 type:complete len:204 (-) Transcript_1569:617-1228(-)